MEYSMDWLPSEVCEDFANCDLNTVEECNRNRIGLSDNDVNQTDKNTDISMYQNRDLTYDQGMYGTPQGLNLDQSKDSMDECSASQAKKYCAEFKQTTASLPRYDVPDSSSQNMNSEYNKKREQKRRPKPKDGTVLICQICGDRALGYNFDAITCESCKAFFRRNALKTKVFTCSFEGNCKLDQHTRKFCSGCRLKKCFDVGMKKDWILSDDQLAKRRKKSNRSDDEAYCSPPEHKPMITPMTSPMTYLPPHKANMYSPPTSTGSDEINSTCYLSDSTDNSSSISSPLVNTPTSLPSIKQEEEMCIPLSVEMEENIANLEKEYKQVFDSGYSEHQAKKMVEKPHSANDLFNMTDIFIRRLIKFAKHIPEFKALKQEDQIFLLKGGIMEILVLRSAMGFDPRNHGWKLKQAQDMKEHKLDPSIIKEQLGNGMYTEHVKFVKSIHQLTMSNNTIMTLMFVIEIFSPDRPNLKCVEAVTEAQEKYTQWLRTYLESIMTFTEAQILYPKLLMKLLDVRNLGESSAQLASHLDITKLEPLLIEVFSLQK